MGHQSGAISFSCFPTLMLSMVMPGHKVLNRLGSRGLTLYDIQPRLAGVKYLTLIDASSSYYNLKLDKKVILFNNIFLSIWQIQIHKIAIQNGSSRWHVLKKINALFSIMPNVYNIAHDILITVFNDRARTLMKH